MSENGFSKRKDFIQFMIDSDVMIFGNFTTKSGRQTPYFINTGRYQTGQQISKLGEFYADFITEKVDVDFNVLYGPAYKGIPLVAASSAALYQRHEREYNFSFNRKEAKDHGEGGHIIGYQPQDGDKILIIEDVITAGTSVRESVELLSKCADVEIVGVVVSVDRMEKGQAGISAAQEIEKEFGIKTYAMVNVQEVIECTYNVELNGKVYVDDALHNRMRDYLKKYGI